MKTVKTKIIHLIVSAILIILTACTPSNGESPVTGNDQTPSVGTSLPGTNWRLISYGRPDAETQVIEGTEVTLVFRDANQAVGSGGCNTFGSEYAVAGDDSLSISGIVSTEIACTPEGVMEQEQAYFNALQTASRFEVSGDRLTIWYEDGRGVLNFSRMTG